MKIFIRSCDPVARIPAAWPHGFEFFVSQHSPPSSVQVVAAEIQNQEVCIPHGNHGARVILTRENPLPEAWRVAAFHSNLVAELSSFNSDALAKADGIVVKGENFKFPLAIATADCLAVAVTLEGPHGIELTSCFHAGWRGYFAGIQHNALNWFAEHRSTNSEQHQHWLNRLHVTIGPAIAGQSYPCGDDVLTALDQHLSTRLRTLKGWSSAHEAAYCLAYAAHESHHDQDKKIFPDLQTMMILELTARGVPLENISVLREDTFASSWWPSHRRAMASGLTKAGRLFTHLCPASCRQVQNHGSNR